MIAIFGPVTTSFSPCFRYLGFVSSAAVQELDQSLKYITIEDYHTEDPRQICSRKGHHSLWWRLVKMVRY